VTGAQDRQRRVVVVRCPAWRPSSQETGQPDGPAARAFERVVSAVEEFCPRIEVLRPGICAFGARGPARYFDGEPALARKVAEAVAGLGYECGVGIADGLFAALLASRDGLPGPRQAPSAGAWPPERPGTQRLDTGRLDTGRLDTGRSDTGRLDTGPVRIVPPGGTPAYLATRSVTVLGEPELADLLVRLGIRTLGEFAAVPVSQVGNRFGEQGLLAHRLSRGLDPRPLVARPPAADLSVRAEFDPPAEQSERAVFAAKALAGRMHALLAASGLACVRVQVQVVCHDGTEITRLWRHDGLLSEFAVAERVRWQLDGWESGAGSAGTPGPGGSGGPGEDGIQGGGISLLRLSPDQLVRDQGRQLRLWGDAVVSDRVARAAVRVQAMLGHDAVRQPMLAGGRGPADQAVLVPFGDLPPTWPAPDGQPPGQPGVRPLDRPWPGRIPPPAPAAVYPVPRPARVIDGSGAPVTVTGRGHVSAEPARLSVAGALPLAITAWTGPWPVTERWWDPAHACRKARFQLVTADGGAWLAFVKDGQWLIEASYD